MSQREVTQPKKKIDWKKMNNPMVPQSNKPPLKAGEDPSVYKSMDFLRDLRAKRE